MARIGGVGHFGDTEIKHFDARSASGVGREEDVSGLEVAVDDPCGVGFRDGVARLEDVHHSFGYGQRPAALDDLAEIGAFEVLHNDERATVVGADVVHLDRVLALEARCRPRFLQEASYAVGLSERLGEHELDGPELVKLHVGRGDDDPHGSGPKDALDAVLAVDDAADLDEGAWIVSHGKLLELTGSRC
jgi:hypothetical protein